jgi:hypothetical protein
MSSSGLGYRALNSQLKYAYKAICKLQQRGFFEVNSEHSFLQDNELGGFAVSREEFLGCEKNKKEES